MSTRQSLLLVVEDDVATSELVRDLALSVGWEVLVAPDGVKGLAMFQERPPDLVLLDYLLPGMNGYEVLECVRRGGSGVPIVMMTAASEGDLVLRALRLGATDFLRKPFEHLQLLKGILTRENQRHQQRHLLTRIAGRVVRQSLEMVIENDLEIAAGACALISDQMVPGEVAYSVRLGLSELVSNAIEHGNLGFAREEKTRALEGETGEWAHQLAERAKDPVLAGRRVRVRTVVEGGVLEVVVEDEGGGFDFNNIPDPLAEENLMIPNGRGVFLARLQFDELTYLGKGNVVRVRKRVRKS